MTYAPAKLQELAAYWKAQGGVNLGIVGDTDHATRGVSYHLGKDQLRAGAYSAERPRDRLGLTNAASAIDLGKLNGSYGQLRAFSDWLARRCVKGVAGTFDVVEVIYSPDGKRVLGFKDGVDFLIPNYGDLSHLTHTHISFYRDAEFRSKVPLFMPFFRPEVPAVQDFTWLTSDPTSGPGTVTVTVDGAAAILPDGRLFPLAKGLKKHSYGLGTLKGGNWDGQQAYVIGDGLSFLLKRAVAWTPDLVP